MAMLLSLLVQTAFVCGIGWLCWRFLCPLVLPSHLDNIRGPVSHSFLKGNFSQLFDRHGWDFQKEISEQYGSVVKLHGLFGTKHLFVFDPLALQSIIVKDQHIYEEPAHFLKTNELVTGPGLTSTIGEHHRRQRKMLNPVFSISHMRRMLPIFYQVSHRLRDAIYVHVGNKVVEVDMLNWMGRTALELIGQAGLGYSFDPLVEDVPNEYGDVIKMLLPTLFELDTYQRFIPFLTKIGTPAFRRRIVESIPDKKVQKLKSIIDVTYARATELIAMKKRAMELGDEAVLKQVGEGKDLISILLKANMVAEGDDKLPDIEILAQLSTLIVAATDTTSNALSRTLHLLAQNPDIQDKLRAEVSNARNGIDLDYDTLVGLPYLDAVCREVLRLYTPVSFLSRETRKDNILPLAQPIVGVNGEIMKEIFVPKDTGIIIGILACNRNKTIWGEDAHEFKPERWLSPLPKSVVDARIPGVYSNLMTFLGGGRSCIGFKFSQLEMKAVLSLLVESFELSLSDKDVVWNISGVTYPTVGRKSTKPQLPLMISRAKSAEVVLITSDWQPASEDLNIDVAVPHLYNVISELNRPDE